RQAQRSPADLSLRSSYVALTPTSACTGFVRIPLGAQRRNLLAARRKRQLDLELRARGRSTWTPTAVVHLKQRGRADARLTVHDQRRIPSHTGRGDRKRSNSTRCLHPEASA